MSVVKRIIILLVLLTTHSTFAADLHVGSGQTYSTIASAITASSSGDTIYVHEGTYNESALTPKSGIDADNRTTITGVDGEARPVIDAQQGADTRVSTFHLTNVSYLMFYRLDIRGGGGHERGSITIGVEGSGVSYVTIDHCKISETNVGGSHMSYNPGHIRICYQESVDHVIVSNCELTGEDASGFKIDSIYSSDITIENNYIHDTITGVTFKWGNTSDKNCIVRNNIIRDVEHRLLYIDQSYVTIENNVLDTSDTDGAVFCDNWGGSNCVISHNTFYGTADRAIYFKVSASNNTMIDNIIYSSNTIVDYGSGNDGASGNFTTDPNFTNAGAHDFSLQPGSGAIGTASDSEDYGADLDLVGIDGEGAEEESTPAISGATIMGGCINYP
ncbi:MAG: hypothetical protein GY861_20525 [bacterium]|nr:hypothetical protein [bacterium]